MAVICLLRKQSGERVRVYKHLEAVDLEGAGRGTREGSCSGPLEVASACTCGQRVREAGGIKKFQNLGDDV